jgi:hypothetical protein
LSPAAVVVMVAILGYAAVAAMHELAALLEDAFG